MSVALPLYGHGAAEASFLSALRSGRLHHAWLIEGPSGIGKARLAERIAAYLLGARGPASSPFDASTDDPVMRILLAGSHPDMNVQRRELNDKGKLAQDINVEQIRQMTHFFSMKPAMGGWRVGIIDSIDEANRNSANALLKTLEEPPPQSLLLLVNHRSRPILPTIRSRCRVLHLSVLSDEDCENALNAAGAPEDARKLAKGRPGLGLRLSSPSAANAASAARALIKGMPKPSDKQITAALGAASDGPEAAIAFRDEILDWVAEKAEREPAAAKVWLAMARLSGDAETLNMDAAQVASKMIAALNDAAAGTR
ncbi:DNA polymerase III subunit delta' [Hyphomonas sp. WL0036]|uniref:DNA polymerase III subunit delta' n=1 Tax=Hyphomonas sediminis TaxID=2866160 RepID=UPI001C804B0A|nr:DNA polymerase III subunit delta' [Hyphomonas sediminis]MBY9067616.1 DNA polymerase III subunit delta' [Hyphomonas sediminis]